MNQTNEIYKSILNRFYELLESEIGDVKPLIYEQNSPSTKTSNNQSKSLRTSKGLYTPYNTKQKSIQPGPNAITGGKSPVITPKKYDVSSCVDENFILPIEELLNENYNPKLLKIALGIIGRETSFGKGIRYQTYGVGKNIYNNLGGDTSGGLAQMKPSTAKNLGVTDDMSKPYGAVKAAYLNLKKLYDEAKRSGYSDNQPSTNLKTGTGDAALDLAILGYNQGISFVTKYCETSDPKIKSQCKKTKTDSGATVYQNKVAKNYFPNYKTDEVHTGKLSSHGYVTEVSNKSKEFNCF